MKTSVFDIGKDLPSAIASHEHLNQAIERFDNFQSLKSEIDKDMTVVIEKAASIKQKITQSLQTGDNPNGLLTRSKEEYLACLSFRQSELEALFKQDGAHWSEKLDAAKIEFKKTQQLLEEILAKSRHLESLLKPKFKFSLKKLPIYGQE